MTIRAVVDAHVHVYPGYDVPALCASALENMSAHAGGLDHIPVLCLAERADCRWFEETAGREAMEAGAGISVGRTADPDSVMLTVRDRGGLCVIAGRQIATAERLEVLSLTSHRAISDGMSLPETCSAVREAGGVPVLSWAPGKWTGRRGAIVRKALEDARFGDLCVCDTAMRPEIWPEPALLAFARERGLRIVAGSDPLPFPGEERLAGRYCSLFGAGMDPDRPAESFRALLGGTDVECGSVGRRCSIAESIGRYVRLLAMKRRSG